MRIEFNAEDGQPLGGTWFASSEPPRAVAVVAGGTGIPHGFYARFARFLAEQGVATLAFDYRGVGASRPERLAGFQADMADWGRLDIPAAHREAQRRCPGVPLVHIGHSVGGQLLGLLPESSPVSKALFFNVSTGFIGGLGPSMRWKATLLFNVIAPIGSAVLGYVPTGRLGLGEDLPTGVARQWGRWCRDRGYLRVDLDRALSDARYQKISFPITSVVSSDDPIATEPNVASLLELYSAAPITEHRITPAQLGISQIGHLGLLRPSAAPLWAQWVDELR